MNELIEILKPENELEKRIISDPEFIKGAYYGRPRSGHPEGEIYKHILEVLHNVDIVSTNDIEREKLRIISLVHDTFKYKVDHTKQRVGKNHHGYFSYEFSKKYIHNESVLQVIFLHDEIYHIWLKSRRLDKWYLGEQKVLSLVDSLIDLDLFIKFFECDNKTGTKTPENFIWFLDVLLKNK